MYAQSFSALTQSRAGFATRLALALIIALSGVWGLRPAAAEAPGLLAALVTVEDASTPYTRHGRPVLLNAQVSDGAPVEDGTVTFTVVDAGDNPVSTQAQAAVVEGTAEAAVMLNGYLAPGDYTIQAQYSGGSHGTASGTGTLTITPAAGQSSYSIVEGPAGSQSFGGSMFLLPNGNVVVFDREWAPPGGRYYGAVYLIDGKNHQIISAMTGESNDESIGNMDIAILADGSFVVISSSWSVDKGAVTWCSPVTGCPAHISAANSLTGSESGHFVGAAGVVGLPGGGYMVYSPQWGTADDQNLGAATYCRASADCAGVTVDASNSLTGATAADLVGSGATMNVLDDSTYVVNSPHWTNQGQQHAGAVTVCRADGSPHGSCAGVVVSAANSLVGEKADDYVGVQITPLRNGKFLVGSSPWHNGTLEYAGAVTLCDASAGGFGSCAGQVVGPSNSTVGSKAGDSVGSLVVPLSTGNYLIVSLTYSNAMGENVGAITFCTAAGSCVGQAVSDANSLTGIQPNTYLADATPLPDGRYVVANQDWSDGVSSSLGLVMICDAVGGCNGKQIPTEGAGAMTGEQEYDRVGERIVVLKNGDFLVVSPRWSSASVLEAGAITLCTLANGCPSHPSPTNSLTGTHEYDTVGMGDVRALPSGGFVAASPGWSADEGALYVGAVTFCGGGSACMGQVVSRANSITGWQENDAIGDNSVMALEWGGAIFLSSVWDNGALADAGAATLCRADGCGGPVTEENSVVGSMEGGGSNFLYDYVYVNSQMVIANSYENRVVFFSLPKAASQVTLHPPAQPAQLGEEITLTATVSSSGGLPSGTVTFKKGRTVLGSAPVSPDQPATLKVKLPLGRHAITAEYSGDGNFEAGSGAAVVQVGRLLFMPAVRR